MSSAVMVGNPVPGHLYYHAGMIHARLGDHAKARDYLDKCLRINPTFSPRDAAEAKKTLDGLKAKE